MTARRLCSAFLLATALAACTSSVDGVLFDPDAGSTGECAVLSACCASLSAAQNPSECFLVASLGNDTDCAQSLGIYLTEGSCVTTPAPATPDTPGKADAAVDGALQILPAEPDLPEPGAPVDAGGPDASIDTPLPGFDAATPPAFDGGLVACETLDGTTVVGCEMIGEICGFGEVQVSACPSAGLLGCCITPTTGSSVQPSFFCSYTGCGTSCFTELQCEEEESRWVGDVP